MAAQRADVALPNGNHRTPSAPDNRRWPCESCGAGQAVRRKSQSFLVLSEESNTDVVIAPTSLKSRKPMTSAQHLSAILWLKALQHRFSCRPSQARGTKSATCGQGSAKPSPAQPKKALTTAELLAAERAQKKAAPVRVTETFAAELLNPAKALPRRRRRPGAALAGFKAMVGNLQR